MNKDFYIVRYYKDGEIVMTHELTKKDSTKFVPFLEDIHSNNGGGITYWYRIVIGE